MKLKNTLGLAMAAMLPLMLVGCEQEPDPAETAADEADIDSQARAKLNAEEAELKEELKKAQEKDPTIKDMYYSVDDNGNKQLNIVRETKNPATGEATAHSDVMPLVTGMALGMLMSNMMNPMGGYNPGYRPSYTSTYSASDERRRKNMATSSYVSSVRTSTARSYVSSRPSSAYARSSGVFSSSSSARSSGYSGGS
jgi:hypothetical protein